MSVILDGKELAQTYIENIKRQTVALKEKPKLVIILAGADEASGIYVRNKCKSAEKAGLETEVLTYDSTVSAETLKQKRTFAHARVARGGKPRKRRGRVSSLKRRALTKQQPKRLRTGNRTRRFGAFEKNARAFSRQKCACNRPFADCGQTGGTAFVKPKLHRHGGTFQNA